MQAACVPTERWLETGPQWTEQSAFVCPRQRCRPVHVFLPLLNIRRVWSGKGETVVAGRSRPDVAYSPCSTALIVHALCPPPRLLGRHYIDRCNNGDLGCSLLTHISTSPSQTTKKAGILSRCCCDRCYSTISKSNAYSWHRRRSQQHMQFPTTRGCCTMDFGPNNMVYRYTQTISRFSTSS